MTVISDTQIVPRPPPSLPELRAADRGVADALESVLSENTRRVYQTQWKLFDEWCAEMALHSLPAEPLTVARYLAVRAGSGASIATLRLASSAITKAREGAGHESPGKDRGVRASLKGWGRRLAKPQRQAGALTADVLAVIRLTAPKPGPAAAASKRPSRPPSAPASTWPWWPSSLTGGASFRGGGADLGRRAALGRRQRPHHRHSLQDRRRGPGRRGGHHSCRHGSPWTQLEQRALAVRRRCSGCRSRRSPGG